MEIKKKLISLFCGAGGLDEGFRQAGFETCLALDFDQAAVNTFNFNHPGNVAQCVDLSRFKSEKFLSLLSGHQGNSIAGIIGGPPCQGVSAGNRKSGPLDPRNSLMATYLRLANKSEEAFNIDFFVFENVPGLLLSKNLVRFEALKSGLSRKFHISIQEVNAQDFGVPQNRRRVLILGLNKRRYSAESLPKIIGNASLKTVRQAIFDLPEATFFSRGLTPAQVKHHPNHWTMNPKSKKFGGPKWKSTGRSFQHLDWDKPSRTVAYGNREIHVHPLGHRRVSVFEAMLFQGFEEKYVLTGNLSEQVAQVSNAVPPPLAKIVAEHLSKILKGTTDVQ